jgi:hypothetical protein
MKDATELRAADSVVPEEMVAVSERSVIHRNPLNNLFNPGGEIIGRARERYTL